MKFFLLMITLWACAIRCEADEAYDLFEYYKLGDAFERHFDESKYPNRMDNLNNLIEIVREWKGVTAFAITALYCELGLIKNQFVNALEVANDDGERIELNELIDVINRMRKSLISKL